MDQLGIADSSGNNPAACVKRKTVKLTKTFGGTGVSDWVFVKGLQNINIKHTGAATIKMERSDDGGTTITDLITPGTLATVLSFTAEAAFQYDFGNGALVRFNCTAYTNPVTCSIGDAT